MAAIRAGKIEEVVGSNEEWVFIDIGFSCRRRTCGVLFGDSSPELLTFSEVKERLLACVRSTNLPLNLVLEAPLSVAWRQGNPVGRVVERRASKTRFWYGGLGCGVLIAATYLLRALWEAKSEREVRLFEGFVSFKKKGTHSDHKRDVLALRRVVFSSSPKGHALTGKDLLEPGDEIRSAFAVAGMDFGVPPVIVADPDDGP